MPADIQLELMVAAQDSMNEVFQHKMRPVQLETDKAMAEELQAEDDAAAAAEMQTALSPTRGRKRPAPSSSGKNKENAHSLSPEGALACATRRALGYY
eukprot:6645184-Prymnesium_polylepis.1